MVDILFLFSKKLCTDGIKSVAAQFMFTLHELEHIELQSSIESRVLRFTLAICLGREMRILDFRLHSFMGDEHSVLGQD